MSKIIITIDQVGNPKVEGEGFSGTQCDKAMKPIEDALQGKEVKRENKPEFYDTVEQETPVYETGNY